MNGKPQAGAASGAAEGFDRAGNETLLARPGAGSWLRLLRPHQWAKNALVFVPLLTSHLFSQAAFLHSAIAFSAFCFCASGVYVLNDLVDIEEDRKHPAKKARPLASGAVPVRRGIILVPVLIAPAFALGFFLPRAFALVLGGYLLAAAGYSFFLKRKMILDVVALALLYTARIIAGGAATGVVISQWLLGFSVFLFLSLALIKRYSEMMLRADLDLPDPKNRAYRAGDIPVLSALAAAAGLNAVVVFSLYLASDTVKALYRRPDILWLACPLFAYWIARMILLGHRRELNDDPLVFALRDPASLATLAAIIILALAAT